MMMTSYKPRVGRSAKTGQFVLNSERGKSISAVEGMRLSARTGLILERSAAAGLSGNERRRLLAEQLRGK